MHFHNVCFCNLQYSGNWLINEHITITKLQFFIRSTDGSGNYRRQYLEFVYYKFLIPYHQSSYNSNLVPRSFLLQFLNSFTFGMNWIVRDELFRLYDTPLVVTPQIHVHPFYDRFQTSFEQRQTKTVNDRVNQSLYRKDQHHPTQCFCSWLNALFTNSSNCRIKHRRRPHDHKSTSDK